jgi:hypothetical protein
MGQIPPGTEFPFLSWTGNREGDFTEKILPPTWSSNKSDVAKKYWVKAPQGSGGGGGGGGSGGGGSGGSSPLMGEFAWDDEESGDGGGKAAVKLFDASGNFLAPSLDDWAGPANFGGLGEGSYQIEYVDPSRSPVSAVEPQSDELDSLDWSVLLPPEDDQQPYDIDAELAVSGPAL